MDKNYEFKLGIAAISWVNDDIPGLGDHYTLDQILSEMKEIGYEATEMGRTFPRNLQMLQAYEQKYQIKVASKFVSTYFSIPDRLEEEVENFKDWAIFLKKLRCDHVIVCEMGGSIHWDPRYPDANGIVPLSDKGWRNLVKGIHQAADICSELGMTLVYHPHAGTVIEQREEIDKLMELTDPNKLYLLFDTGHAYYGNYDPLEQLTKYYDRIKYVHYKDVRKDVFRETIKEKWNFRTAVLNGLFTVPGDGCIDFNPIIRVLMERGYRGWTIVEAEQDPDKAHPYKYAKMAKDYLDQVIENQIVK